MNADFDGGLWAGLMTLGFLLDWPVEAVGFGAGVGYDAFEGVAPEVILVGDGVIEQVLV